jgi:hypothetical protein
MAFCARILASAQSIAFNAIFDCGSSSCCMALEGGSNEQWTEDELEIARGLSQEGQCSIALSYIERFGGDCDHWAVIVDSGRERYRFEEHSYLTDILGILGVTFPPSGYFATFDPRANPLTLPRI